MMMMIYLRLRKGLVIILRLNEISMSVVGRSGGHEHILRRRAVVGNRLVKRHHILSYL